MKFMSWKNKKGQLVGEELLSTLIYWGFVGLAISLVGIISCTKGCEGWGGFIALLDMAMLFGFLTLPSGILLIASSVFYGFIFPIVVVLQSIFVYKFFNRSRVNLVNKISLFILVFIVILNILAYLNYTRAEKVRDLRKQEAQEAYYKSQKTDYPCVIPGEYLIGISFRQGYEDEREEVIEKYNLTQRTARRESWGVYIKVPIEEAGRWITTLRAESPAVFWVRNIVPQPPSCE